MRKIKTLLMVLCASLFIGAFSACNGGEGESLSQSVASENSVNSETDTSSESEENSSTEEVHTHQWDNGTATTPPTCETAGVKTFACSCGESYTEEIPAGHVYVKDICTVCGNVRVVSQGLEYELNEDGVSYSVTGIGTCEDTDLVIPSTYENLPVTSIGEVAFYECTSLTSVEIPNSVTSIGDRAFVSCTSLTSVVIPDSVMCIGLGAFGACTSLTSVEIPDSVTSIGAVAFGVCDSLTNITVLENNSAYQSIDGNLYTKDGTTLIQYAIGKTDTSFTIPDSVTSIGYAAFYNCTSLTSVEIPNSVTSIGGEAFSYCDSLTSVEIPNSVTSIAEMAFFGCPSLTSVVIGNSVTSIGDYAFIGCTALTSVVIPDSVTSIGEGAFSHCVSLTSVYYKGTAEEWAGISIGYSNNALTDATRYYYSESQPTEAGNWWHYVDGEPTAW